MSIEKNSSQGIILYSHSDDFRSHWIRLMFAEKQIKYQQILTDYDDEDVQHLSPYHSLPILVEQNIKLYHCLTIAEYIDERYRQNRLYADNPMQRAEQKQYLWRLESDWFHLIQTLLHNAENLDKKILEQKKIQLSETLIALTPLFQHFQFFLSDQFSVLDCLLAPILLRIHYLKISLPQTHCRAIYHYSQRVFKRPAFIQSLTLQEQILYKETLKEIYNV